MYSIPQSTCNNQKEWSYMYMHYCGKSRPKPWHQQTPGVGGACLVQLGPPVDHHVNGLLVVQDCWTGIAGGIPNEILSQGIDLLV